MTQDPPLISVVIVNFKVPFYLHQTIRSLKHVQLYDRTEVVVVDNASRDNSRQRILDDFPEVQWIELKDNVGFGKACNVGARHARGTYLLFLNPDTMVSENTLTAFADFLSAHPQAGIVGPKVLNPDGTLQESCRRGFPTPTVSFYRLSGLSRLFPKSKVFGRYNMTFLDPDETAQVDAISGSCMCMSRELFWKVGGFDERFFMYGEDLDLCARARAAGREVWYLPATQIVHFKGRSANRLSIRSRLAFYHAMVVFSRKYHKSRTAFFPQWLVLAGIGLQAATGMTANIFRSFTACFIDLLIVNAVFFVSFVVRFSFTQLGIPYNLENITIMLAMHALISMCYLWVLAYQGVYSRERYSARRTFAAGLIAAALFMTFVFFIRSMAYSRISIGISSVLIAGLLVAWREFLPRTLSTIRRTMYSTGRVLVLGNGDAAEMLIESIEKDRTAHITGVIWPQPEHAPGQFKGYPVVGTIDRAADVLGNSKIDLMVIATAEPWYSHIIKALSSPYVKSLTIRWVPHELCDRPRAELPDPIPLHDFSV